VHGTATERSLSLWSVGSGKEKSNSSGHYGNSEVCGVDNLLYVYTQPLEVVVDPFAGGERAVRTEETDTARSTDETEGFQTLVLRATVGRVVPAWRADDQDGR
jgi:hypothetical protein